MQYSYYSQLKSRVFVNFDTYIGLAYGPFFLGGRAFYLVEFERRYRV